MVENKGKYLVLIIGSIFLIFCLIGSLFFIPISNDVQDITVDMTIHQPAIGEVEVAELSAQAKAHTLLSLGSVTEIVGIADDILDGDDYTIQVTSGGIIETKEMEAITRTTEIETSMKLKNVPISEEKITVELYEGDNLVDVKEVTIE